MIKQNRTSTRRTTPRKNAGQRSNATAAKAIGQNKARRNATMAAKRGITSTKNANAMDVERQVNRATRRTTTGGGRANTRGGGGGGGGVNNRGGASNMGGGRRITAPKASAVRAKARNLAGLKSKSTGGGGGAIKAPTQQAIGAAAKAMKGHGFTPPKGMQMQISFVPKKQQQQQEPANKGGRGGRSSNAGRANTSNANNNKGGRGGGNRGRGGRGRGGGRR